MKGMKKRILSFVLVIVMTLANVMFVSAAQSAEAGFSLDGYGVELVFTSGDEQMVMPSIWSGLETTGQAVGELLDGLWEYTGTPTKPGATFEGWAKFYPGPDEDGNWVYEFQKKSDNDPYYTIDEVMAEPFTRETTFAAKWSDIAIEDYYVSSWIDINYYGEDTDLGMLGSVWNEETQEEEWVENKTGTAMEMYIGLSVGHHLEGCAKFEKEPTRPGSTFEGWAKFVCDYDNYKYTFEPQSATKKYYTTEEMLNCTVPTYDIAFVPKWSDIAIEDYYKEGTVMFSTYDEEAVIKYQTLDWDSETEEWVWYDEESSDLGWGIGYGLSLKEQQSSYFRIVEEPKKAGATFEGWAKFKVDEETGEHTFVPCSASKMYYTTEEVLAEKVADTCVEFAAKWSDIPIEDYYPKYYDAVLDMNGGEIVYTSEYEGETYVTNSSIQYFNLMGNKSLQTTLKSENASITSIRNNGKTLDSWKVYEMKSMDIFVAREGDEIPKTDDEQLVVYYYTFEEEGEEFYLVFKEYKIVDEAMSTEKLLTQYAGVNYYAVANWKDSVTVVEDTKVKETLATEQKSVVDAIVKDTADKNVVSEETAANVKAAVGAGQEISTELVVYPVDEALISSTEKAAILNEAAKELGTATNVQFLDIQVVLKADEEVLGNINELQKEIEITVAIPEDMKADGAEYVVIRNHDGEIDVLPATVNADGTITFKTDKFSTYALAYAGKDSTGSEGSGSTGSGSTGSGSTGSGSEGSGSTGSGSTGSGSTGSGSTGSNSTAPGTGDNSMILVYALVCVAALAVVVVLKKRESYN